MAEGAGGRERERAGHGGFIEEGFGFVEKQRDLRKAGLGSEGAGGGGGGGIEQASSPAPRSPALVFPETPDFPSWNALSQSSADTGGTWMAAGLGVRMVGGGGGGDGDVSLAASVTSSALPCTPMLAKTELVTILAELIAAKDHGQVRS
jgi:hypothetical protein